MLNVLYIDLGSSLAQFFLDMSIQTGKINPIFFSTKWKVRSCMERAGCDVYPVKMNRKSISPLTDEQFNNIVNDKLLFHKNKAYLRQRASFLYSELDDLLRHRKVDGVFVWNGSGLAASVAKDVAKQHKVPVMYGENGYFPHTIQIDNQGVNNASSITQKVGREYGKTEIVAERMEALEALIRKMVDGNVPPYKKAPKKLKPSLKARVLNEIDTFSLEKILKARGINQNLPRYTGPLPDKYIFVPLQVVADSQVIMYSPLVGNDMALFVRVCYEAVKKVAPDYRLVVKPHPADVEVTDYVELAANYPELLWVTDRPSLNLIENASVVITINSTVGLEGVMLHKPVITLGDNFYNVEGVVQHITAIDQLEKAIETALNEPLDVDRMNRLLYYLYYEYFVHGSWKDYTQKSYAAIADSIEALLTQDMKAV